MIQICSRHKAEEFIKDNCNIEAIISINDVNEGCPDEVRNWAIKNDVDIFILHFDDVESENEFEGCKAITREQAGSIIWMVFSRHFNIFNSDSTLLIHCGGGVSRSAAAGAALLEIAGKDNSWIFDNPKFSPNRLVFDSLIEASKNSTAVMCRGFNPEIIKKADIDKKFEHNLEIWKTFNL